MAQVQPCNEDCFNCLYPDCVFDGLTGKICRELDGIESDYIFPKTWKQRQTAKWHREYRQTHKEELAAKEREYYQTHKEEIEARQRKYYQTHKEEIATKRREYYQTHKEEIAAKAKERRQAQKGG